MDFRFFREMALKLNNFFFFEFKILQAVKCYLNKIYFFKLIKWISFSKFSQFFF